ncbi:MAG: hypothetical protein ACFFG0_36000, partial [Candidatus Thorarchaeota archaeon]
MMSMEKELSLMGRAKTEKEKEAEAEKKLEKLNAQLKEFSNTIDGIGNALLIGKPEQVIKQAGEKIDKTFSDMSTEIMKVNPAVGGLIKALQLGAKWFIGYQMEMTKSNEMLLTAERSMGIYNRTFIQTNETRKAMNKEVIRLEKELGVSTDDVKNRLSSMIASGFKPAGESIDELKTFAHESIEWFTLLKEGMGLSEQSVKKFTKTFGKEFNLGMKESGSLIYSLSKNIDNFNVSQEEELNFYTDLINKGKDYGLTLDTIKKETDKAKKAGLSWSQTIRQISEVSMLGRRMNPGQQTFWGGQLGSQGNMWQAQYEMTFGKLGKGEESQGKRMLGRIAEMAGLNPKELGQMKGGDVMKFAFYATQLSDITKETAMQYAMGNKEYKNVIKSLKDTPYKENIKELTEFKKALSESVSGLTKFTRDLESGLKDIFYHPIKGAARQSIIIQTIKGIRENIKDKSNPFEETKVQPFQDFISRPGLEPISFSPQDTIIGTKTPEKIMSGGGEFNINIMGAMTEGLESYVKRAVGQFFEDKINGM